MKIQFFFINRWSSRNIAQYKNITSARNGPIWLEDFKQQYAKQDIHLARYYSIFHMFAQIYHTAWNDFEIECNGEGIKWTIAENHMNDLLEQRVFTVQSGVSIGKYC